MSCIRSTTSLHTRKQCWPGSQTTAGRNVARKVNGLAAMRQMCTLLHYACHPQSIYLHSLCLQGAGVLIAIQSEALYGITCICKHGNKWHRQCSAEVMSSNCVSCLAHDTSFIKSPKPVLTEHVWCRQRCSTYCSVRSPFPTYQPW